MTGFELVQFDVLFQGLSLNIQQYCAFVTVVRWIITQCLYSTEVLRDGTNNGFEGQRIRKRVIKLPVTNDTSSKNTQNYKNAQGTDTC